MLWLGIDNVSFDEAAERIIRMCRGPGPAYVVTPNVDHYMLVRKSDALREVYEQADLALADGMPVVWASKILGRALKGKVSGSDLFEELCRRAAAEGLRVFLAGGDPGVAEKARRALERRHPGIRIAGTHSPVVNTDGSGPGDEETVSMIRRARPQLLFAGFGCPKQEMWIARHRRQLGVPVCIGVGASFDFVAGTRRRAPVWMQRTGLEWLWRLAQEPRRLWKRYLINDLPFFWHVLREWAATIRSRKKEKRRQPGVPQ